MNNDVEIVEDLNKVPKSKNNKKIWIIVGIFIVLILGGLGYYYYKQNNLNNYSDENEKVKEENNSKSEKDTNDDIKEENIPVSEDSIDELSIIKKFNKLTMGTDEDNLNRKYFPSQYLTTLLKKMDLKNDYMMDHLLYNTSSNVKYIKVDIEKITNKDLKSFFTEGNNDFEIKNSFIDLKYYQDIYFDMFGSNPKTYDSKYVESCPSYYYDSYYNGYFEVYECGYVGEDYYTFYLEKVESIDSSNVVAYFRMGFVSTDKDYLYDGEEAIVYSSVDRDKKVSSFIYSSDSKDNFIINNDNYKDFSLYKITFKKDENNYYFKDISKGE